MGAFDDHVARGIHVDNGRVTRVRFDEPDYDGDVVSDALVRHGDGTVGLEEVDGAAIVVGKSGGFGLEGRVAGGEGKEVLADQPFGVFGVREGRRAALGEDGGEELLDLLGVWRRC